MAVSQSLQAKQSAAGAPIAITCQVRSNAALSDTLPNQRVGVTTTITSPATFSALAHTDVAGPSDTFWDTASQSETDSWSASVPTGSQYVLTESKLLRLDSNYVAGRFLWFVGFASGSPSAGDAPTGIAGPFLIA